MLPTLRLRSPWLGIALCFLLSCGCGGKTAGVKGTIVFPPGVKLKDTDNGQIVFVPEQDKTPGCSATISSADNSFVVEGPKGSGVPLGKYKISVRIEPYPGYPDSEQRSEFFSQINEAYTPQSSPLTYEVTDDSSITIDVARGTVTKK